MNTNQLINFVAVATFGSFSAAALHLDVEVSTIGKSMKTLEVELGHTLFYGQRGRSKRLVLTVYGEHFLPVAKKLLNILETAQADLAAVATGKGQILRLVAAPSLSLQVHQQLVEPFREKYPDIHWQLRSCNIAVAEQALLAEEVELGFADADLWHPQYFEVLENFPTSYHIICHRKTKLLDTSRSYTLAELKDIPIFLGMDTQQIIRREFARCGLSPNVVAVNSFRLLSLLSVKKDLGITIYPSLEPPEDPDLTWVPLRGTTLASHDLVFKAKGHQLSPIAELFWKFVTEVR